MPERAAFINTKTSTPTEGYYSTLLHELTHWSGAADRCARDFSGKFGDEAYAFEELVAELGAAFMCAELQIEPEPRIDHAQYVASWLRTLKGDARAILTASSKAQAAADYLAGLQDDAAEPEPVAEPAPVDDEAVHPYIAAAAATASDRPRKILGVTYRPNWPWTKGYAAYVRARAIAQSKSLTTNAQRERAYNAWKAERDARAERDAA